MAIEPLITPPGATEAVRAATAIPFMHTPVSGAFRALLGHLAVHIRAERDLENVDRWDPAFFDWVKPAELSLETVTTALRVLGGLPVLRGEDEPLLAMAEAIDDMIGAESEEEARVAHAALAHLDGLLCPVRGLVAMRINHMLITARRRLGELATLDTYALSEDCLAEDWSIGSA